VSKKEKDRGGRGGRVGGEGEERERGRGGGGATVTVPFVSLRVELFLNVSNQRIANVSCADYEKGMRGSNIRKS
jgi:hypothetical protein